LCKNGIRVIYADRTMVQGNLIGIAADGVTELGNKSIPLILLPILVVTAD